MSSANIIYFWLHFDDNAKKMIFQQCQTISGFSVAESVFDQAFDLNPDSLINQGSQNATAPADAGAANSTAPAAGQ